MVWKREAQGDSEGKGQGMVLRHSLAISQKSTWSAMVPFVIPLSIEEELYCILVHSLNSSLRQTSKESIMLLKLLIRKLMLRE